MVLNRSSSVFCLRVEEVSDSQLVCQTGRYNQTGGVSVSVFFGKTDRIVPSVFFRYLDDPIITDAVPGESYYAYGPSLTSSHNPQLVNGV